MDNGVEEKIFFSKFVYTQILSWHAEKNYVYVKFDLIQNEFSVQVYKRVTDPHAVYETDETFYLSNNQQMSIKTKAVKIAHGRNDFNPELIPAGNDKECIFSYGIKLNENDIEQLKPYCNAVAFQKYIGRKAPELCAYRDDGLSMSFDGCTNSHIPYMHFDMDFVYPKWPTEILWNYICDVFIKPNKELRKIIIC